VRDSFAVAEDQFEREDYRNAFHSYRGILLARLEEPAIGKTTVDALAVERLADLATLFGHYSAAEDLLTALVHWLHTAGNGSAADYALIKVAAVRFARNRLNGARRALEELSSVGVPLDAFDCTPDGLQRWERDLRCPDTELSWLLRSRFFLELSKLLAAQGLYQPSLTIATRGLALAEGTSSDVVRRAIPALMLAAATASLERGDFRLARRYLQDERADQADFWRNPAWSVRRLELRAKLQLLSGDLGAARVSLEAVLATCVNHGFDSAGARGAMNLAHALIIINQTKTAFDLLDAAERQAREAEDNTAAVRAARLKQLAMLRSQSLADMVAITPSVTELWLGEPSCEDLGVIADDPIDTAAPTDFLALFEDRALLAHQYLATRNWPAARLSIDELQHTFASTDSMIVVSRLLTLESMLQYHTRDFSTAREGFTEALAAFRELGLLPDEWQAQRFLGWTLKQLGQRADAERAVEDANRTLETLANSLTREDRATFRLNKWTADEEDLAGQVTAIESLAHPAMATRWWRRVATIWRLRRRMAAFLSHIDRHQRLTLGRATTGDSAALGEPHRDGHIPWRLRRNSAVIGFLVLPDRILVARLFGWRVDLFVRPITRVLLRQLVADWHTRLVSGGPPREAPPPMERLSAALGLEALIDGLPARVRHLRVVTDDSLRGVPFAAFEHHGRPLVERYTTTAAFAWAPDQAKSARFEAGLVIGSGKGGHDVSALPQARVEVDFVAEWLTKHRIPTTRLDDEQASHAAVAAQLAASTHVHIASHGVFHPDRPDCSGLIVGGDGREVLSVRDIAALNLSNLPLGVLSACWSADNFVLPGRYVISLPYVLWRAGTRSVVAALWEIDDRIAMPFMRRFYTLLGAESARDALRLTQLECVGNRLPACALIDTSDPVCWSGFQLYGDGRVGR